MSQEILSHVLEFQVLFTHQISQKIKKWCDGRLKFYKFNNKTEIFNEVGILVGSSFLKNDKVLEQSKWGDEFKACGVLITIESLVSETTRDISRVFSKSLDNNAKQPKVLRSVTHGISTASPATGTLVQSLPSVQRRKVGLSRSKPRRILDASGHATHRVLSPRTSIGRAPSIPQKMDDSSHRGGETICDQGIERDPHTHFSDQEVSHLSEKVSTVPVGSCVDAPSSSRTGIPLPSSVCLTTLNTAPVSMELEDSDLDETGNLETSKRLAIRDHGNSAKSSYAMGEEYNSRAISLNPRRPRKVHERPFFEHRNRSRIKYRERNNDLDSVTGSMICIKKEKSEFELQLQKEEEESQSLHGLHCEITWTEPEDYECEKLAIPGSQMQSNSVAKRNLNNHDFANLKKDSLESPRAVSSCVKKPRRIRRRAQRAVLQISSPLNTTSTKDQH